MDTIIATQGLTKRFGGKTVVNHLDLSVPRGAIFALLGGNGAGKSTTIRMLTGLLPPDDGSAEVLGEDCWSAAIELRHRIGYVPERPRFYDWMTVEQIGWFTAGFHRPGFLPRYVELIQRFRLGSSARLKTLSKGGYAKVGLALALASDPEVLILDEPTSGLDLFIRREFLASMVELAGAGRTILLSSHGIAEVERVASHAGFMAEGRLLLAASIEELRKRIVARSAASGWTSARRLDAGHRAGARGVRAVVAGGAARPQSQRPGRTAEAGGHPRCGGDAVEPRRDVYRSAKSLSSARRGARDEQRPTRAAVAAVEQGDGSFRRGMAARPGGSGRGRRKAMIPAMVWKEYREHRAVWLALAVVSGGGTVRPVALAERR